MYKPPYDGDARNKRIGKSMDIKYILVSDPDCSSLVDIWKKCFGDSEEYIRSFIEKGIAERYAVAICDSRPVGMTALVPCFCGGIKCYYVYALCVLPEYRRQGIARDILDLAFTCVKEEWGGGLILHPAEKSLFEYYCKAGFDIPLWGQSVSVSDSILKNGVPVSLEDFIKERDNVSASLGLVQFEQPWLELHYGDILGDGGFCVSICGEYFLGNESDGVVSVVETSRSSETSDFPVGLGKGIPADKKYILTLMGE